MKKSNLTFGPSQKKYLTPKSRKDSFCSYGLTIGRLTPWFSIISPQISTLALLSCPFFPVLSTPFPFFSYLMHPWPFAFPHQFQEQILQPWLTHVAVSTSPILHLPKRFPGRNAFLMGTACSHCDLCVGIRSGSMTYLLTCFCYWMTQTPNSLKSHSWIQGNAFQVPWLTHPQGSLGSVKVDPTPSDGVRFRGAALWPR